MQPIATNRDIVFDFRDSCNCCAWRRPNRDQPMYVSRRGGAEPYRSRLSDQEQAAQRTYQHIQAQLQQVAERTATPPDIFSDTLARAGIEPNRLPTRAALIRLQGVIDEALAQYQGTPTGGSHG
jgi:hypothetical protein